MHLFAGFTNSKTEIPEKVLDQVRVYLESVWGSLEAASISENDSIQIRSFLLDLVHEKTNTETLNQHLNAIMQFYAWAQSRGIIQTIPKIEPLPGTHGFSKDMVRRRGEIFIGTPEQNEISRLKALNNLSDRLNRAHEIQDVLKIALSTLVDVLQLNCGWIFLLPIDGSPFHSPWRSPPHDFALSAAVGLPPSLQGSNNKYLCRPDDCHCQEFFRAGRMKRPVNVVECTRLLDAANLDNDNNEGLRFHASVPIHVGDQPAGIINLATEDWQLLTSNDLQILSLIGSLVSETLSRARLFNLAEAHRARMEAELQLAHEVQTSLLPQAMPGFENFSIAADWRAAREMAGDFYDFIDFGEGKLGIVIGDVSDKGAPAAMFMAMTRSLIRMQTSPASRPSEILQNTNVRISSHSSARMFVTVFYGVLDTKTCRMTYASAGQDPPLLRRADSTIEKILPSGPLIGVFDRICVQDREIHFSPGDTLLMYTDGLTDAMNAAGERFELERLEESLARSPIGSADKILANLIADLADFSGDEPAFDDMTCVVLVCK